ncbi:RHS domain-containing protein [Pseudomonas fluorescens]|nr:RHS domain-containing protein [Pseudomonas fluorescens]
MQRIYRRYWGWIGCCYNPYGKITAERDELGRVTRYEYADGLHLISRRINPDGTQLKYRYNNTRLLLTEIENEVGETYQLAYHANGLIQQETGFDGRRTAYTYDLNGHLLEKTEYGDDDSQLVTGYERDYAGRLVRKNLPDGSAVDYTYDRLGNLLSVDDGHWALSYEYDLQNRLTAEHQGWGTLRYGYDHCGQLKHLRLPDNNRLAFQHDKGGHLATVELNGKTLTSHLFKSGREHQRQQGQLLSHYHYDDQGRLHAHALTQQEHHHYRRQYDYDKRGNLIRERRGRAQQLVTEYRYDCQHRLIGITQPDGRQASYRYDPFGRRISKTVDEKTTEFFWQGDTLIAEHSAGQHRSYVYEPDSFRPLVLLEGFGPDNVKAFHYQLDHLGTPQELTNPDGEIVWSAHYRAYGQIARLDINTVTNPLRFQGQYFDQESGLHYNRHRYYNPDNGRYLTPDPVKLAGGLNGYQYVPNPTGWVDPLGLACIRSDCPQPVAGGTWKFNSDVDIDWRKEKGDSYQQMNKGLGEAFRRAGAPKDGYTVTKWGKDQYGKSFPTEWRVLTGPRKGAEVNIDNPQLVPSTDGPSSPHIGYQTSGKRGDGGAKRGHILLELLPVSRSKIGVTQ